jgi:hypothetical protein
MACVALGLAMAVAMVWTAGAQTDKPTRAVNDRYHFAFTFEANSLVTYPENGDGFSCVHNPQGGGKNTKPDYGLLVFGSPYYNFTADEAKAAKLGDKEMTLAVEDVHTTSRLSEILRTAMETHGYKVGGDAVIKVEDGPSVRLPYFSWSEKVRDKTHYALMYVTIHGDAFITLQVEASQPLSPQQVSWFTTKLELLKLPPPPK